MDGRGRRRSRRWDRWYKRSQSAGMDRDGRGRATTPAEASLGLIVSNEPNLPRPSRKRPWLPGPQALPTLGSSAPNEANFPPAGRRGPGPARSFVPARPGRNVRNKANCAYSGVDGKCLVNKEL